MTVAEPITPLKFELRHRTEAYSYNKVTGVYTRDRDADAGLPEVPPGFTPMYGTWEEVAAEADRLNAVQTRASYLHHFFFPEAVPAEIDSTHCAACRRIAVKEAVTNEDAVDDIGKRLTDGDGDAAA
jgi:hypothetical protein